MILSVVPVSASAASTSTSEFKYDLLSSLKIIPNTMDSTELGNDATRLTLAYVAAKLSGAEQIVGGIEFTDVEEVDKGYVTAVVERGIMNVEADGTFGSGSSITAVEAKQVILDAVAGNMKLTTAEENKILRGYKATESGYITNKQLFRMAQNALTINLPVESFRDGEDKFSAIYDVEGSKTTVLADRFNISVYEGTMKDINVVESLATIDITKNVEEANPVALPNGKVILNVSEDVNLHHFNNAPVTLWVQGEDIVYMELQKYVEIKYTYLYAVNGDATEGNTYSPEYIKNIHYYGDDEAYLTNQSELRVVYNDVETKNPVNLIGNFAKTILREDEVIFIQAWDLQAGGILTEVTDETLVYTQGDFAGLKMKEIDGIANKVLFTDGRVTDMAELKANTYFDYYKTDDSLVLVTSEKIITGEFGGVNGDSIKISGTKYYCSDELLYSTDGSTFSADADYTLLFGKEVDVYFNYNGYAQYVSSSLGQPVAKNDFMAAVVKYVSKDSGETIDEDLDMLILFTVEGGVYEKKIFSIEDQPGVYQDDITAAELSYNALEKTGDGIYIFTLNGRGNICKIERPTYLTGYKKMKYSDLPNGRFPDSIGATPWIHAPNFVGADAMQYNSVIYFDVNDEIVTLNSDGGYFEAKRTDWASLSSTTASDVYIHLFAEEEYSADMRVIIICGTPTEVVNRTMQQGIVAEKSLAADEDGDLCYELRVVSSRGDRKYKVSKETGETVEVNSYIEFSDDLLYTDDEIRIKNQQSVAGDMSTWNLMDGTYKIFSGTVYKFDKDLIFFDNATSGTYHRSETFVIRDHGVDAGKFRWELGDKKDIVPGALVTYTASDSMKCIIVRVED